MTPQELKNSILQLAIQGKLVEQRPEEGTAEELFQQIQEEKQQFIKAGKIKNEKSLPEIAEEEKLFDIPKSWKWTRLKEIVYNHGQMVPTETFSYIDIGSIDNKYQQLSVKENLLEANEAPSRARRIVNQGDILYSTVRPYLHNMCIVNQPFSHTPIASTGFAVMACYNGIDNKYLFYYLMTPAFDSYANANENSKGVAYPAINDDRLYRAAIAVPPIAEQKRIVAKIEELLPYIDRYEQAWSRLDNFNKRFPDDMKKSILQLAIQGKLVEQQPEDGTAEELYQQIQEEKRQLIKAGKIKKEKSLPEIAEAEMPFEIPENWMWIRLGDCGPWSAGATPSRTNPEYYGGTIPWLKTGDLNDGVIVKIPEFISKAALEKTSVRLNPVGSVLMAMYGATIGKLGILAIEATTNQACCACIPYSGIYDKYLFFFLMAYRTAFIKMGEGGAQPNISKEKIVNSVFPLPPLSEQKRIVAKLEELLPLCERLK